MTENELQLIVKIINTLLLEVGYFEKASNKDLDHKTKNVGKANYTKYGRDMHNLQPSNMDFPAAWCACLLSWGFTKAFGLQKAKEMLYGDIDDYTVSMASRFKNNNAFFSSPVVGDIVFFKNTSRICHVGLIWKVHGNKIYTIEGNTSSGNNVVVENGGCVAMKNYDISNTRIAGYGRPKYSVACPTVPVNTNIQKQCILEFIDVSHHNTIDLKQAATKYKDIIIRIGYRSYKTGALTIDKKFLEHTQGAIVNNMRYGFYFYDQSLNEAEAIEQADWIVGLIKPLSPTYPIVIDSEYYNSKRDGRADKLSKDQRTKNIIAFCERIKQCGYIPCIYASDSWFKNMLDFEQIKKYDLWCARYNTAPPTISKYEMWQYGSTEVPGSLKPIDINRLYKEYSISSEEQTKAPESPLFCKVVASVLNVRNKPATGSVIDQLRNGYALQVYSLENGWCKISDSEAKYVSYKYILPTKGKVTNCNKLNCRQSPVSGKTVFILSKNDEVNILRQDEVSQWYYIERKGKVGYVSNKYITI